MRFEDGTIIRRMREALVRSMAEAVGVHTNGFSELWLSKPHREERQDDALFHVHESVVVFLRQVADSQYVILKPSIQVLDSSGVKVPPRISEPVKQKLGLVRVASDTG